MDDQTDQDDWVAGGVLEATSRDLSFFAGQCIPIDTGLLPDPPEQNLA